MSILKLAKGTTTPVVLTITGIVREVPSSNPKYGPQHKLVGHTPTDPDACIFLSPGTAVRQLARVGLTLDNAIGHAVAITRPSDYIDFNQPNGAAPTAVAASAPAASTASGSPTLTAEIGADQQATKLEQLKKLATLHKRCLQFVLDEEVPLLNTPKAGGPVGGSPESISALTAQLFIAATQAGLGR